MEEVEGDFSLWDEMPPKKQQRKVLVTGGAWASNEVVFESLGYMFGSIVVVHLWWCELAVNASVGDELEEGDRGFIVQTLEFGVKASCC